MTAYLLYGVIFLFGALVMVSWQSRRNLSAIRAEIETENACLSQEIQSLKDKLSQHDSIIQQLPKIIETQSVLQIQMKQSVELLEQFQIQLQSNQNDIQLLQSSNNEDKLYIRAKKLIELGAGADEVIAECGMSRSEVELLIALNEKRNT